MDKFLALVYVDDDDWQILVVADEVDGTALMIDQSHSIAPEVFVQAQAVHQTEGLKKFFLPDENAYDDFMGDLQQGIWTLQ